MNIKITRRNAVRILLVAVLPLLSFGRAVGQDDKSVKDLIELLRSGDPSARERATYSLAKRDKRAVPELSAALKDGDPEVKRGAAYALGGIGPDARDAVPALSVLLTDDDKTVRRAAARSLGQIGPEARESVPALLGLLDDDSSDLRVFAAQSLGEIKADPKGVIPQLLLKLRDKDPGVRITAVRAVQMYGPEAAEYLSQMLDMLTDGEAPVRAAAAMVIGGVGPKAAFAVPDLVQLLKDDDPMVRISVAQALGEIGPDAKTALPALRRALHDRDHTVRGQAADALGKIGADAEEAIQDLIESLGDQDRDVREFSARALGQIAIGLSREQDVGALDKLRSADAALRGIKEPGVVAHEAAVSQAVDTLEAIRSRQSLWRRALNSARSHPWMALLILLVITYALLLLSYFIIYWRRPLLLLQLSEKVEGVADIKVEVGKLTLSPVHLILIAPFRYRRRVLDAWVARHADTARAAFEARSTVSDRLVYAPIPVTLNKGTVQNITVEHLRPLFSRNLVCLIIQGEGGSGKTSLACLFGRWATEMGADRRLCETHLMLPVLIESDPPARTDPPVDQFLTEVGNQLRGLVDERTPLSAGLLRHLLRQGRVLVIVDGLSEMKEESQKVITAGLNGVPANATIITSRSDGSPGNLVTSTLRPMRIDKEHLLGFVVSYLSARGKDGFFNDPEITEALDRLLGLVGGRNVTALLAKLYIESMIASKEKTSGEDMPQNIPELMVNYVRTIYEKSTPYEDGITAVHNAAQVLAWNCVRRSFRPAPIRRSDALKLLPAGKGEAILRHLEVQLKLIQGTGRDQTRVRFTLDPLAEYFAGWYVVAKYGSDEMRWQAFIDQAKSYQGEIDSVREFLLAVLDWASALRQEVGTPAFAVEELKGLTAKTQSAAEGGVGSPPDGPDRRA